MLLDEPHWSRQAFIHSGSTLLNCVLSGHPRCGWPLGCVSNVIGDESTGKTLLGIEGATLFLLNPPLGSTDPRVVYIDSEYVFNEWYARSLGMPFERVDFCHAEYVEEVFDIVHLQVSTDPARGTLVIVDSWDALSAKFAENAEPAIGKGYASTTSKARAGSEAFRRMIKAVETSRIHLMIISQTRQRINGYGSPKVRSGGDALNFYSSQIIWLSQVRKLLTSKKWVYGITVRARCSKNKIARPFRECEFSILFDFGIDDVASTLRFLAGENVPALYRILPTRNGYYDWGGHRLRLEQWVERIESDPQLYRLLLEQTSLAWQAFEHDCTIERTPKSTLIQSAGGAVDPVLVAQRRPFTVPELAKRSN